MGQGREGEEGGRREGVGGSGSGVLTIATVVSDTLKKKMTSVILIELGNIAIFGLYISKT